MLRQPSPLQSRLLKAIAAHPTSPLSYRELAKKVSVSSTNTVSYNLRALEKKGYLKRDSVDPRIYQVLGQASEGICHVSLYGLAHCGPHGSFLNDAPVDRIALAIRVLTFPVEEAFLVKAEGDSMEPRICAGDIVLSRKQNHADTGQIIVCVNERQALIKKLLKKKHSTMLISLNPKYDPMVAADDFRVVGLVKNIVMGAIPQS